MNKKAILLLLLLGTLCFCGCDMFRRLAGRPTAEELAVMRIEMLAEKEAAQQARIDSLRRVEKALADSLAILDSLQQMHGTILNPSEMGGLFTTRLEARYYIVVGSFMHRGNAESLLCRVSDAGYSPVLINFRNGFNAVGVEPSGSLRQVMASLRKVKAEPFCPPDVWILVND
ncbi:MAG: hypothetical protein IAB78_02690 [Bacteroidetes bacterium]|uniref:SPOR domain-containing protein n=1 Tax=Candidatus Cryptobacteroides excrementavium TaxID=2840759 RepID=A0A9D9NRF9_9BACT|nr:hypothetical protein [Candidatus Cryptobacteroides excrementavium]